MKVAVTVWGDRISPLFDASRRLLVATIDRRCIVDRSFVIFNPDRPSRLTRTLVEMSVPVLICGAVSQLPANVITAAGIRLIPFIAGKVDRVLAVYATGSPLVPAFIMPGCLESIREAGHSNG